LKSFKYAGMTSYATDVLNPTVFFRSYLLTAAQERVKLPVPAQRQQQKECLVLLTVTLIFTKKVDF